MFKRSRSTCSSWYLLSSVSLERPSGPPQRENTTISETSLQFYKVPTEGAGQPLNRALPSRGEPPGPTTKTQGIWFISFNIFLCFQLTQTMWNEKKVGRKPTSREELFNTLQNSLTCKIQAFVFILSTVFEHLFVAGIVVRFGDRVVNKRKVVSEFFQLQVWP